MRLPPLRRFPSRIGHFLLLNAGHLGRVLHRAPSLPFVCAALVALQIVKMISWFHAVDPRLAAPLLNVDYIQFWGRALRASAFLSASGRFWGYDPFDMAGYVSGPFLEVGVHFLSLAAHALSSVVPIHRTLLVIEIAGLSLAPFLVIPAVRNFGGTRVQAWSAFAIVLLMFGFIEPFSERMIRVGLFGFMMSTFVSIFQISLAWRWLSGGTWRTGAGLCAVSAALFQIHPASLIIVAVPNIVLFLFFARGLGWVRAVATLLFVGVALAANAYWIRPFVAFSDWKTTAPYFVTHGLSDLWRTFNPWGRNIFGSLRLVILLYVLGLGGVAVAQAWHRRRALGATLSLWIASLFVAGFFGSHFSFLSGLQPGRNEFAFWMVTAVAAGMALPTAVLIHARRRWMAGALYAVCVAAMFLPLPGRTPGAALTNRMSDAQRALVEAIRARPVDGRILLECVDSNSPHIADLLPFLIPGQAFLGGQHPGNFIQGRFSLFTGMYVTPDGWDSTHPLAFGQNLANLSRARVSRYFDLYNVKLVAARSSAMRGQMARLSDLFESSTTAGGYAFYPVRQAGGWFEQGSGKVTLGLDHISINEASAGRLVLKCHWIRTLKVRPVGSVRPVYLEDDPVPFIAIDNTAGLRELVVYNAGL